MRFPQAARWVAGSGSGQPRPNTTRTRSLRRRRMCRAVLHHPRSTRAWGSNRSRATCRRSDAGTAARRSSPDSGYGRCPADSRSPCGRWSSPPRAVPWPPRAPAPPALRRRETGIGVLVHAADTSCARSATLSPAGQTTPVIEATAGLGAMSRSLPIVITPLRLRWSAGIPRPPGGHLRSLAGISGHQRAQGSARA